jgi:hypothetical protein
MLTPLSGKEVFMNKSLVAGVALVAALVLPGFVHAGSYLPEFRTTGVAPLELNQGPTILADSVCRAPMYVFASDHTGDVAQWYWLVAARRVDEAQAVLIVGTADVKKTAGAATWTATLAVDDSNHIRATVTGAVGVTIDWLQTNDEPFCMTGVAP